MFKYNLFSFDVVLSGWLVLYNAVAVSTVDCVFFELEICFFSFSFCTVFPTVWHFGGKAYGAKVKEKRSTNERKQMKIAKPKESCMCVRKKVVLMSMDCYFSFCLITLKHRRGEKRNRSRNLMNGINVLAPQYCCRNVRERRCGYKFRKQ